MHDSEENDESDIDYELPTFPIGKEATVENILHVVQVVTRRQTRQQTQEVKENDAQQNKQEKEIQEADAGKHATAPNPRKTKRRNEKEFSASPPPVMKPFVRPKRVANAEKERTRKYMTFLPISNEDNDDDDDERDRILDAHDILVAGRMEREGDEGVLTHEHEEA